MLMGCSDQVGPGHHFEFREADVAEMGYWSAPPLFVGVDFLIATICPFSRLVRPVSLECTFGKIL